MANCIRMLLLISVLLSGIFQPAFAEKCDDLIRAVSGTVGSRHTAPTTDFRWEDNDKVASLLRVVRELEDSTSLSQDSMTVVQRRLRDMTSHKLLSVPRVKVIRVDMFFAKEFNSLYGNAVTGSLIDIVKASAETVMKEYGITETYENDSKSLNFKLSERVQPDKIDFSALHGKIVAAAAQKISVLEPEKTPHIIARLKESISIGIGNSLFEANAAARDGKAVSVFNSEFFKDNLSRYRRLLALLQKSGSRFIADNVILPEVIKIIRTNEEKQSAKVMLKKYNSEASDMEILTLLELYDCVRQIRPPIRDFAAIEYESRALALLQKPTYTLKDMVEIRKLLDIDGGDRPSDFAYASAMSKNEILAAIGIDLRGVGAKVISLSNDILNDPIYGDMVMSGNASAPQWFISDKMSHVSEWLYGLGIEVVADIRTRLRAEIHPDIDTAFKMTGDDIELVITYKTGKNSPVENLSAKIEAVISDTATRYRDKVRLFYVENTEIPSQNISPSRRMLEIRRMLDDLSLLVRENEIIGVNGYAVKRNGKTIFKKMESGIIKRRDSLLENQIIFMIFARSLSVSNSCCII